MYEIKVDDSIMEVSLEELVHMLIAHEFKFVWYVESEKGNKRMLVNFLVHSDGKILNDGRQVFKRLITEVVFTEVEDYKRMIIYDHCRGMLLYTNNKDGLTQYETTSIFLVLKGVDTISEKVKQSITAGKSK